MRDMSHFDKRMKLILSATPSEAPAAPFLYRGCSPGAALAVAAELGYDGVELHLRQASDVDAPEVRRQAEDLGLRIPTLGTGLAAGLDGLSFAHPDPALRRQAVDRVKEHIELASVLGAAVIIGSLSGRVGGSPEERPVRRTAALDCLREVCRSAAAVGVTVLLEPLNRYECDYLNTIQDALAVGVEIGAPNLRVLADTFHMNIEEVDLAKSLELAGSHLGHVHLADSNRQAAGHGHLNIEGVLRTLQMIGYCGYISFEVFPAPTSRQAAEDAIRTVRSVLDNLALANEGSPQSVQGGP
jgi:5-keto-L-gluconate epimerase